MTSVTKRALLAGCALAISYGAPVWAQTGSGGAASPQAPSRSVEEIVVTARRREEAASRVPIAVSALSQESLTRRSIVSMDQVAQATPGLTFGKSGGATNPQIVIRGQSRANIGDAAQPVLTYFNDVPLPYMASVLPTYDLASVQVLRGPQGTLFGRNSTSGAVLVNGREPNYSFAGYAMAGYGNLDAREVEGALNIPIIEDKLALRVSGRRHKRDGYVHVVNQHLDQEDIDDAGYRISVLAEPVERVKNLLVYDYWDVDRRGNASIITSIYPGVIPERLPGLNTFYDCGVSPDCDIDLALARQEAIGRRNVFLNDVMRQKAQLTGVSNTTTMTFGQLTLKNIFGLRTAKTATETDTDGTTMRMILAEQYQNVRQTTEELQLQGDFLDGKLQTIVGAFYLKSKPHGPQGLTLASFSPPSRPSVIAAHRTQTNKSLFGSATYDLGDFVQGLKIDAGLRRNKDETSACAVGYPAVFPHVAFATPAPTLSQCVNGTTFVINGANTPVRGSVSKARSSAWTWNVGLNYQATEDLFFYGTVRRGYRAGGVNTPLFNPAAPRSLTPFQSYEPETVTDAELGVKAKWTAGDMYGTVNFDVYRGKYKGSQRGINGLNNFDQDNNLSNDPSAGTIIVNAGDARVQGFELEATVTPIRHFTVGGFVSLTDAKYTSSGVPPLFNVPGFAAFPSDPKDTAFPYAPKWTMGLNVTQEIPLQNDLGTIVLAADAYHQSRIWFGTFKSDLALSQKGYTVANARVDWREIAGSRISAGVFARNLTDESYVVGGSNTARSAGFTSVFYAEPRTYGAQLRVEF